MKIDIAINGPSTAGKSTIAKILAKELGYSHLNAGTMYCYTALTPKKRGIDPNDEAALTAILGEMKISFDPAGNVYLNNKDVSKQIRKSEIPMLTNSVSAHPKVREHPVALQRQMVRGKGFIMDGRDVDTIVLPDARLKIYMVTSIKARADRRYKEYLGKHAGTDYDEICRDIEQRDYQDMNCKTSSLHKTEDTIKIDTSNMMITEAVKEVYGNTPALS